MNDLPPPRSILTCLLSSVREDWSFPAHSNSPGWATTLSDANAGSQTWVRQLVDRSGAPWPVVKTRSSADRFFVVSSQPGSSKVIDAHMAGDTEQKHRELFSCRRQAIGNRVLSIIERRRRYLQHRVEPASIVGQLPASPMKTTIARPSRTMSSSPRRPTRSPSFERCTVVILSTIMLQGIRRPF